ncbi:hypothetical protein [Cerasicoccus fimbriatus]|uniref:hypothetical protein n=1 Tax=Cerasicoccus fimbriatus TaxID=3014554 RepID=UPI0022B4BCE3|nr:hypothetical protein [Cerasicoccus sp. TK19100]
MDDNKTSISTPILAATSLLFLVSQTASAQTLISQDFDGGSTTLNGTTPTFVDGSLSGTTWEAPSSGYSLDGVISTSNTKAVLNIGSFINDQKGNPDAIFQVSATVDPTAGGGNWIAVGIYGSTYKINESGVASSAGVTLYRDNGEADGYTATQSGGTIVRDNIATGLSGAQTYGVTLDLTEWDGATNFGTITFNIAGNSSTPYAFSGDVSFAAIGLGTPSTGTGNITSFEFSQIPEPHTYSLMVGLMALGALVIYRRKR